MTFFLEISRPAAWRLGIHSNEIIFRVWFAWFAFGWLRVPFREFSETVYTWENEETI